MFKNKDKYDLWKSVQLGVCPICNSCLNTRNDGDSDGTEMRYYDCEKCGIQFYAEWQITHLEINKEEKNLMIIKLFEM
jgi:hypothetical protein